MPVPLRAFVVQVASACLVGTATRQSPKAAPALALVAAAAVAPVPSVRADHYGHSSEDGPWSVTCGGCTFSGNYAGAPLARSGSCATDCTWLDLRYRAITSMPGDPFADMGALEELRLYGNDLTSLETGVFDALVSLRYVGEWESARGGVRRWVMPPRMRARSRGYAAWTCARMGRCAWAGGTRARGRPRPDGVMIVCPGNSG